MKKKHVELGATYAAKVSGKLARVRIERESPHGGWEATNVDTGRSVRIRSAQRLRRALDAKRANEHAAAYQTARAGDDEPDAAHDPDVCATLGCGRPSALTYLGRPRCQECYEDEACSEDEAAGGGDQSSETPNHEEIDMAAKKSSKKSVKTTKAPKAGKGTKAAHAAKPASAGTTAKAKAAKPAADAKPKRTSALDAAAEVLRKSGQPMRSQEMIAAMAEQGLWSSPNGKTPHATLYAAILREINDKGAAARFKKVERGQFAFSG